MKGSSEDRIRVAERFWSKVDTSGEHWLWTGAPNHNGYGVFWPHWRQPVLAHVFAYEQERGPVSEGFELDHLCRVKLCVRPDHLEAVTHRENVLRGDSPSARHARQTHCIHGHPFDEANTHRTRHGARYCRACGAARQRARHAA